MNFDYRDILANELERRLSINPSYSLRSFARDLEVSPSRLSEVINKKRGTSVGMGKKISKNLGLSSQEEKKFLLSIESLHGTSAKKREQALERLRSEVSVSSNQIDLEQFKVISEWYYNAILELLDSQIQVSNEKDISKRLGLKESITKNALKRLLKLNLIKKTPSGGYVPQEQNSFTPNDIPSEAIKSYHDQILELARHALYKQRIDQREFGSVTMAFNSSKIDEAKKIIRECRKKLSRLADNSEGKESIYVLGTQFFRLDQEITK